MKKLNLIIILWVILSILFLSGCTTTQANDDEPQICSIDQIAVEESCE